VLAGAAAAYDPALRPRFDLLIVFAVFVLAAVAVQAAFADKRRDARMAVPALLALGCGVILVLTRGWAGFWAVTGLGLLAVAFAAGPRLRDTPLAGPATIAALGPLATAGAALALVGHVAPVALWIGLPIGFLADATRRARETADEVAHPGVQAHAGDTPAAPPWFAADLLVAYGMLPALAAVGALPLMGLAAWITLPLAVREPARARAGRYAWAEAAQRVSLLHLGFALVLAAAVFVARIHATRAA